MQKVIQASANEAASDFQRNLIKGHSDLTLAQIQTSVATFKASYLATFGFNQSLPVKYVLQMANLFQFHLGSSFFLQSPQGSKQVIDIIVAYLPNTILLFTTGTLLVVGVGTILGLLAARSAGGKLDRSIPIIAVIHSSLPTWWIGFILIAVLRVLPQHPPIRRDLVGPAALGAAPGLRRPPVPHDTASRVLLHSERGRIRLRHPKPGRLHDGGGLRHDRPGEGHDREQGPLQARAPDRIA